MRTLTRLAVLAAAAFVLALGGPAPAQAKPDVPTGCDLVRNTMCHCLPPGGTMYYCTTID